MKFINSFCKKLTFDRNRVEKHFNFSKHFGPRGYFSKQLPKALLWLRRVYPTQILANRILRFAVAHV